MSGASDLSGPAPTAAGGRGSGNRRAAPRAKLPPRRVAGRMAAALLSILVSLAIFLQFLDLAATGVELWTGARALLALVATYLFGLGELIVVCTIWFGYRRAAQHGRLRAVMLKVTLLEGLAALAYLPLRLLVFLPLVLAYGDRLIDAFRLLDLLQAALGVILVAAALTVPRQPRRSRADNV